MRCAAAALMMAAAGCGDLGVLGFMGSELNMPGAVFTTNETGGSVNKNIFETKDDVFLNGGPAQPGAAGLEDGTYVIGVTDPSGDELLSPLPLKQVAVSGGEFTQLIALAPFADSEHGVYKVWASLASDYPGDSPGTKGSGFQPSKSRTDNFRVLTMDGDNGGDDTGGDGTGDGTGDASGDGDTGTVPDTDDDADDNGCPDSYGARYGDSFGDVNGDVWGDVYGASFGTLNGNLVGNHFGDIFGTINGNVYGDVYGDWFGDLNGSHYGRHFGDRFGDTNGSTGQLGVCGP